MTGTRLFARALIRLSPQDDTEDVTEFLQGLVTSDVAGALPVWTALLTPQGKVLFDFFVWPSGKDLLLDCEAEFAEALVKRLSMYRLRRKIGIAVDPHVAVHWRGHSGDGAAPDPRLDALGERWLAPVGDTDEPAADELAAEGQPPPGRGADRRVGRRKAARGLSGTRSGRGPSPGGGHRARAAP